MKKYIANVITGSRAIFSLPLLFIPVSSVRLTILYLFCGITDMIDGAIARKTGAVSEFGARLDTASEITHKFMIAHLKTSAYGALVKQKSSILSKNGR